MRERKRGRESVCERVCVRECVRGRAREGEAESVLRRNREKENNDDFSTG